MSMDWHSCFPSMTQQLARMLCPSCSLTDVTRKPGATNRLCLDGVYALGVRWSLIGAAKAGVEVGSPNLGNTPAAL